MKIKFTLKTKSELLKSGFTKYPDCLISDNYLYYIDENYYKYLGKELEGTFNKNDLGNISIKSKNPSWYWYTSSIKTTDSKLFNILYL